MSIEKITMKQSMLGGGKVSYPARKAYRPPFTKEFTKDILPMVMSKKYPQYFDVVYSRAEDPVDPVETSPVVETDLEAEAARLNAEVEIKSRQKGKK